MSEIDQAVIAKIARMSSIHVPQSDYERLQGELGKILDWVAQLREVDVRNVEPLANVNDDVLHGRPDIVNDGNQVEAVLTNAPSRVADFFSVPKVVE